MRRHLRTASSAALIAVAAGTQAAEDPNSDRIGFVIDEITVVGTRTERNLNEVDATISVIDREDIERRLFRDIQDLVRYEPGVSVGGTGSRFGLSGFTIRGIGGNRVLTLVDGIRIPDEFSFGPFLSARRDFVDVDTIERVEIARGPVSTLYGSDALGGVVAITTRAPNDYVSADDPLHLEAKTGYSSEDESFIAAVNGAYGNEDVALMLNYTNRTGSETETSGSVGGTGPTRSQADPQDLETETIGAKIAVRVSPHHNLIAGYEVYDSTVETTLLSDFGTVARGAVTNTRNTEDDRDRTRLNLSWRYDNEDAFIQNALITLYRQESETVQFTLDNRTPAPRPPGQPRPEIRTRNSFFEQEIEGVFGQASSRFEFASSEHTVTFGIDVYETDNSSRREGAAVDAATGEVIPPSPFAPALPSRDFPLTTVQNQAFFLQDEIVFMDGRLRVTPGLRFDDYEANVSLDPLFVNGSPGQTVDDYDDSDLTLKLGALYQFTDQISGWARYSEGFRAPPYDDVNVGFTNFAGGYKTIAAPNLSSETSAGFEFGMRFSGAWGEAQIAAFTTEYDNFIESFAIAPAFSDTGGIDPADGLLTFQSINRDEVTIDGVEFRGRLALGALQEGLRDFYLETAAAYAKGEDDNDVPIDSIDPLNAVVGVRWAPASARYDAELVWTWAGDKDSSDINPANGRPATDGYNVIDLLGHYELTEQIQLDVGIFNLFDEDYIRWADTAGVGGDAIDRFTRPGRNFSATLRAAL